MYAAEATSRTGSWSKLGSEAEQEAVKGDTLQPTMMLDLKCCDDYHKEHIILHEFGHALGLAHEHQHPDYLSVMKKFLDENAMMIHTNIMKVSSFLKQYGELKYELMKTSFDAKSIMHYP